MIDGRKRTALIEGRTPGIGGFLPMIVLIPARRCRQQDRQDEAKQQAMQP
jgi:hypothetical protein